LGQKTLGKYELAGDAITAGRHPPSLVHVRLYTAGGCPAQLFPFIIVLNPTHFGQLFSLDVLDLGISNGCIFQSKKFHHRIGSWKNHGFLTSELLISTLVSGQYFPLTNPKGEATIPWWPCKGLVDIPSSYSQHSAPTVALCQAWGSLWPCRVWGYGVQIRRTSMAKHYVLFVPNKIVDP